jgi:hypothetical protein
MTTCTITLPTQTYITDGVLTRITSQVNHIFPMISIEMETHEFYTLPFARGYLSISTVTQDTTICDNSHSDLLFRFIPGEDANCFGGMKS